MHRFKAIAGALTLALLVPAAAAFAQVSGSADFTTYVSLGDSLTAGFTSGSLVQDEQLNSYPALINAQAKGNAASGFQQPLVSQPGIPAILQLRHLFPTVISPKAGLGHPTNLTYPKPYNNLAVPGATLHNLVSTVTDNGGLHDLILRGLGTQIQQAAVLKPSFISVWIGNNDVLGAATSGVVIDGVTLTPLAAFQADFAKLVTALKATNAKLVFANIPRVTSLPFVTTIPPILVNPATNQPVLINGAPVPLIGPNGPLRAGDHVLLTASAELAVGKGIPVALGGTGQPLSNTSVLSIEEAATIDARRVQFNQVIKAAADANSAAFVDAEALLDQAGLTGIPVGGLTFTPAFLTGGIFGYDGVHPTPFGYA
ncbi:MAG TPA: SGNH/GDSL hydrolase family protein, partial [Thermoanaerobaculia bacterium]